MNKRLKIMIADDSKMERRIFRDYLTQWGYEVYEAVDGKKAIEMYDMVQPDLIIMDGVMPEMDGYVACAYLHRMRPKFNIPVILITAYDNPETVARAFAAGAVEYLVKPIYWDIFKLRLQRILVAKKTEIALFKSEEKLQGIFNNAVAGISMGDSSGNCIYVNQKVADMLGYSIDELYQLNLCDVTYPEDWPRAKENMGKLIKNEIAEYDIEKRFIRKDKTVFWGKLYVSAVYNDDNKFEYFVGVVIDITDNKQLDGQIKLQNKYLLILNEVSSKLLNRLDLDDVLGMIVKYAVQLSDSVSGSLYLLQENGLDVELKFAVGVEEKYIGFAHGKNEGLVGEVFSTGKPFVVDNYREWEKRINGPGCNHLGLVIGIPLISAKEIVGVIVLINDDGWKVNNEERLLLERFAGLASIAYDNAMLYKQAQEEIAERKKAEEQLKYFSMHDSLTGLYNRNYFEEEIKRIANGRYNSFGIIVGDIDGLKEVNDTLGHACGDALIIAAGDALKKACRSSDVIARIGGDEFVVLLPGAQRDVVEKICERIEAQATCQLLSWSENGLSLSVGYAVSSDQGINMEELFKEADKNMYINKMARKSKKRQ